MPRQQDATLAFDPDAVVVSEKVVIDAPASVVWDVLTDLPRYGEWNPFCFQCESTLEMGAPVMMKLNSYEGDGAVFDNCEYVCAFEPEKLLSWEVPHVDDWPYPARRDQIIEALGPEQCAYHSTDALLGPNGIHVKRFAGGWIKRAFDDTALALKARAEAIHAGRAPGAFRSQWRRFCEGLQGLGEIVGGAPWADGLDRAEGYRYLTRLLRLALESNLEHSSLRHPSFFSLSNETAKIGADNPDNLYLNAVIDGRFTYEIVGNVGGGPYLSFGTKENRYAVDGRMISTGEVDLADLQVGPDGEVRIVLSEAPAAGNWLPMTVRSNMVIVRQTFNDRGRETPARMTIRRLDAEPGHDELSAELLDAQLQRALGFVGGTATTFRSWVEGFRKDHRNRFQLGDQKFFQAAGGDPNICYIYAFWEMAQDEALQVRSPVPRCDYWNFQLTNPWMESLDYRHHRVHLNQASAVLEDDGDVNIHVSHTPIAGLRNNLVTMGHRQGVMLMRWVGADEHPVPELVRLKRADLEPVPRPPGGRQAGAR